jgi:hypothetical protein
LQLKRVTIEESGELYHKGRNVREDKVARWRSACLGKKIKLGV